MGNKHNGMIKGFYQLSKAWYGEFNLKNVDYIDAITFGFYDLDGGGTTGEMTIEWVKLNGEVVPKLIVFSDAWSALSNFHDLIDLLGKHDGEDSSPKEFCEFLLKCGFIDITQTTRNN